MINIFSAMLKTALRNENKTYKQTKPAHRVKSRLGSREAQELALKKAQLARHYRELKLIQERKNKFKPADHRREQHLAPCQEY